MMLVLFSRLYLVLKLVRLGPAVVVAAVVVVTCD
jgi:hypothetical protein